MYSYNFTDASNLMIKDDDIQHLNNINKSQIVEHDLTKVNIIGRFDVTCNGFCKKNVIALNPEFKERYPKESELFFEEAIIKNKFYQLRITDYAVRNLYTWLSNKLKQGGL